MPIKLLFSHHLQMSLLQPGQRHGTNHSGRILQTLKRKLRCEEGNQQNAVWQLFAGPGTVSLATVPSAQCQGVRGASGSAWARAAPVLWSLHQYEYRA